MTDTQYGKVTTFGGWYEPFAGSAYNEGAPANCITGAYERRPVCGRPSYLLESCRYFRGS